MKRALVTGITGQDGPLLAQLPLGEGTTSPPSSAAPTASLRRGCGTSCRMCDCWRGTCATANRCWGSSARSTRTRSTTSQASPQSVDPGRRPNSRPTSRASASYACSRRCAPTLEARWVPCALPGFQFRDVRSAARVAPERAHRLLSTLAVRGREDVRSPHDDQLPRVLWGFRMLRHPVQPRKPGGRSLFRHPEDHSHRTAARTSLGLQDELVLSNINVRRDWRHAEDYVGPCG